MNISKWKDIAILREIEELLASNNSQEKGEKLDLLSDVFEYGHDLNEKDIVAGAKLLLPAALQEKDEWLKGEFFDTLNNAVVWQEIGDFVDWDVLIDALPSLEDEKEHLGYALKWLGLSQQEKYLSVLDAYTHHPDPEMRERAHDGIADLKFGVARAAAHPKEEK